LPVARAVDIQLDVEKELAIYAKVSDVTMMSPMVIT
jgi:hypothetical protein